MSEECTNPLLLGWLKEWWDDAREKNSKGVLTYKKAYESMKSCPISFNHPSEAIQLHGLGPKLCDRLTAKLEIHCRSNGLPFPQPSKQTKRRSEGDETSELATESRKKPRKIKPYVPSLRSGPYALIMALSTVPETSSAGMTKSELTERAQTHCDSSFTAPSDPSKFYTAWNSMKTLQNKDLVYEFGRPTKRYALTEEGWEAARRIRKGNGFDDAGSLHNATLYAKDTRKPGRAARQESGFDMLPEVVPDCEIVGDLSNSQILREYDILHVDSRDSPFNAEHTGGTSADNGLSMAETRTFKSLHIDSHATQSRTAASGATPDAGMLLRSEAFPISRSCKPIHIPPGAFTVELVLDNREVRAKNDQTYIQNTLVEHGVVPSTRSLPLGDALWVARLLPEASRALEAAVDDGSTPSEVVLGHIAERKRLDDLIGSITDGRFHEQKFRLRRSGIPNVIYIIEDIQLAPEIAQRRAEMVTSAIAGTMVVSGFHVKRTRKLDETIIYLAQMTKLLRRRFEGSGLDVVPSHALGDGRDIDGLRDMLKDGTQFLTFDTFAALAGKNDNLTLRDVFLKMLMCTKGVTGDKALEIQRKWQTPRAFIEALKREEEAGGLDGDKARRELVFKAAGQLIGRKKIGKAVSARLYDIWGEV